MRRSGALSIGAVMLLCLLCVALRAAQMIEQSLLPRLGVEGFTFFNSLTTTLALQAQTLREGALWQPLTYALVHGSPWHLTANLFGLLLTGRALEAVWGRGRMVRFMLLGAVAGAIGFLVSVWLDPRLSGGMVCVGASAVVTACIGAATALAPRERVVLWVICVPIPLRALWLLPVMLLFFLAEAIFFAQTTAYGAHLGGYLAGLLYAYWTRY